MALDKLELRHEDWPLSNPFAGSWPSKRSKRNTEEKGRGHGGDRTEGKGKLWKQK